MATHTEAVGVDIERVSACDEAFARSICTPAESFQLAPGADRDRHYTSLWSSKEALAKGLGNALAYDPRRLDSPLVWRAGRAGAWRAMALPVADGHVGWLCWRSAGSTG